MARRRVVTLVDERRKFDRIPRLVRQGLSMVADALPYAARGKNYLRMLSRPNALERYFEEVAFSSYFLRQRILAGSAALRVVRLAP